MSSLPSAIRRARATRELNTPLRIVSGNEPGAVALRWVVLIVNAAVWFALGAAWRACA